MAMAIIITITTMIIRMVTAIITTTRNSSRRFVFPIQFSNSPTHTRAKSVRGYHAAPGRRLSFPFGQSPRGWSAEQRNHQFTPCGVARLSLEDTLATQRSIAALPAIPKDRLGSGPGFLGRGFHQSQSSKHLAERS
jgi:hypothetical protein